MSKYRMTTSPTVISDKIGAIISILCWLMCIFVISSMIIVLAYEWGIYNPFNLHYLTFHHYIWR